MKVKALRNFGFKKVLYASGKIFEATPEEVEVLNSTYRRALVEVLEQEPEVVEVKEEPEANTIEQGQLDLDNMTKKEIQEYAITVGIELSGRLTKEQMIQKLQA